MTGDRRVEALEAELAYDRRFLAGAERQAAAAAVVAREAEDAAAGLRAHIAGLEDAITEARHAS